MEGSLEKRTNNESASFTNRSYDPIENAADVNIREKDIQQLREMNIN